MLLIDLGEWMCLQQQMILEVLNCLNTLVQNKTQIMWNTKVIQPMSQMLDLLLKTLIWSQQEVEKKVFSNGSMTTEKMIQRQKIMNMMKNFN